VLKGKWPNFKRGIHKKDIKEGGKEMTFKGSKRTWLVLFVVLPMLLMVAASSEASPKERRLFGFYAGWSFGLGDAFAWHHRSYSDRYGLDFHFGAYAQYNISDLLGVQLDVSYQHGRYDWEVAYPGFLPTSGTERFGFLSADLNGVINCLRSKGMEFYILGGGGITAGDWYEFSGTYFNWVAGAGVKIFLSKTHSRLALTLGGTFRGLIEPESYWTSSANYLRFQVGLEF
jgi:hypothetical protein